jgi:hypothetical protein
VGGAEHEHGGLEDTGSLGMSMECLGMFICTSSSSWQLLRRCDARCAPAELLCRRNGRVEKVRSQRRSPRRARGGGLDPAMVNLHHR